eukprot:CAMPEP_0118707714 /NCGR_PEP_ID=MMETSP0800-20121206/21384_1 /TAXON_ID=210618 ORGANISM="Striatella unipunctata, Strain CCMP2910" /NCGR_SAMPLE_ID=MMETSP0800 /ASSEMBLY_ACC=CAM_ASM_000638 /LENGTH=307 /DNA_ID=CAMNT_0006610625 /DNA_START=97 /DNA_END=1020 /DNA_ORIENTATION=-
MNSSIAALQQELSELRSHRRQQNALRAAQLKELQDKNDRMHESFEISTPSLESYSCAFKNNKGNATAFPPLVVAYQAQLARCMHQIAIVSNQVDSVVRFARSEHHNTNRAAGEIRRELGCREVCLLNQMMATERGMKCTEGTYKSVLKHQLLALDTIVKARVDEKNSRYYKTPKQQEQRFVVERNHFLQTEHLYATANDDSRRKRSRPTTPTTTITPEPSSSPEPKRPAQEAIVAAAVEVPTTPQQLEQMLAKSLTNKPERRSSMVFATPPPSRRSSMAGMGRRSSLAHSSAGRRSSMVQGMPRRAV